MTLLHPHPESEFRRAGVEAPRPSPVAAVARAVLAAAAAAVATSGLSAALAWVGFVPLIVAARSRSWYGAAAVGALAGVGVILLDHLTRGGDATARLPFAAVAVAVPVAAASLARGRRLVWLIPAAWAAVEWLAAVFRAGPPPLAYAQARWPIVCQLADVGGAVTVSFIVLLVNVTLATARPTVRDLTTRAGALAIGAAVVFRYGWLRLGEAGLDAGPVVRVSDATALMSPATADVSPTTNLADAPATDPVAASPPPDLLIVDAGEAAPPLNAEARSFARGTLAGRAMEDLHYGAMSFAYTNVTAVLVAAPYAGAWQRPDDRDAAPTDRRRAAYAYDRLGTPDGIRLDPPRPLPRGLDVQAVFKLDPWRVGVALGGELTSPLRVRGIAGGKRADVIVAFTGDDVPPDRLRPAATLRAIEHRATVVLPRQQLWFDAGGRMHALLSAATLTTDRRGTIYGRWGDAFATLCALGTIAGLVAELVRKQWFAK